MHSKHLSEPSRYPLVDVAPSYKVDPEWPKKPADVSWGGMPGVWVDKQDRVWLYTRGTPAVQVYSVEGEYLFGWSADLDSIPNKPKSVKLSSTPHGLMIDHEEHVWLADLTLQTVSKHAPNGDLLMSIGTPGVAGLDETHFNAPTDMATASNGDVFITDGYGNNRVVHCDAKGGFIKSWGTLGNGDDQFSIPHSIVIDSKDRIYVADRNNVRVQIFNTDGELLDSWKNVIVPWNLWVTENEDIWVCGSTPMRWHTPFPDPKAPYLGIPPKDQIFMRFNTDGRLLQVWSVPTVKDGKIKPGELDWLHCLAFDSKGNLYCGDIKGERLQKFDLVPAGSPAHED